MNNSIFVGARIQFHKSDRIAKIANIDRVFFENGAVKVAVAYTWTNDPLPYAIWPDDFSVLDEY